MCWRVPHFKPHSHLLQSYCATSTYVNTHLYTLATSGPFPLNLSCYYCVFFLMIFPINCAFLLIICLTWLSYGCFHLFSFSAWCIVLYNIALQSYCYTSILRICNRKLKVNWLTVSLEVLLLLGDWQSLLSNSLVFSHSSFFFFTPSFCPSLPSPLHCLFTITSDLLLAAACFVFSTETSSLFLLDLVSFSSPFTHTVWFVAGLFAWVFPFFGLSVFVWSPVTVQASRSDPVAFVCLPTFSQDRHLKPHQSAITVYMYSWIVQNCACHIMI